MENPKIYAGIVFNKFPTNSDIGSFKPIDYALRFNSTGRGISLSKGSPKTRTPGISNLQKSISTDAYSTYSIRGFLTMQTLVNRFLNCMPSWDFSTKTTNGECTTSSSSTPSSKYDNLYFNQIKNDVILSNLISIYSQAQTQVGVPSFNDLDTILSNEQ